MVQWTEGSRAGERSGAPGVAGRSGEELSLQKMRLRGNLLALHNSLRGGCSQRGQALLPGNWTRGNDLKL